MQDPSCPQIRAYLIVTHTVVATLPVVLTRKQQFNLSGEKHAAPYPGS